MRKLKLFAALAILSVAAACQKTGEGEYQVEVPKVDVDVNASTDTAKLRTPTVETGTRPETTIVNVPSVDVKPAGTGTSTKP